MKVHEAALVRRKPVVDKDFDPIAEMPESEPTTERGHDAKRENDIRSGHDVRQGDDATHRDDVTILIDIIQTNLFLVWSFMASFL